MGRCISEPLLKEDSSVVVLVAPVLLVLHQHQLAVGPLLLGEEVPHCVLLKLEDRHECSQTGQVGASSCRRLPCVPLLSSLLFFPATRLLSFPFDFTLVSLFSFALSFAFLILFAFPSFSLFLSSFSLLWLAWLLRSLQS